MLATAEIESKFWSALNDGSIFKVEKQEIYSSIYVYEHTSLITGYPRIAAHHKDIDTVVIPFNNTTN